MLSWGTGPQLGLLSICGYLVFVAGAAYFWRSREDFSVWVTDEVSGLRRTLSRHTAIGPFYGPREESVFKAVPAGFLRSLTRMHRKHLHRGTILMFLGALLLLLDFFI
jgi:hypothetical protein